jgi:PAS domain S-box-containing protein
MRYAVERNRADAARRRENERLSAMVAVQEAIAATPPELEPVLRMIVHRARDLTRAAAAMIGFPDGAELVMSVATDHPLPGAETLRVSLEGSLAGHCLKSGQLIHCPDVHKDPRANREACRLTGARSLILVPLHRDGKPAAVLTVYSPSADAFDASDVTALRLIAGVLEGVLAKAAAFEEKRQVLEELGATVEALREAQERFATFMDNSPALSFIQDEAGRFVYVNKTFERYYGGSVDDWIGKTVFDKFPPDVAGRMQTHILRALEADQKVELTEDVPTPDGMRHWLIFKFPLRDAKGRRYLGGKAVDITERKRAETLLREHEQLFRQVLDSLPVGVVIADGAGTLLRSNPEANRIWGGFRHVRLSDLSQYRGWWADTNVPLRPEEWALAVTVATREKSPVQLVAIEAFDGSRKTVKTCAIPVLDEARQVLAVVVVIEDVTLQRQAEQRISRSERRYRSVVAASSNIVWTADADGNPDTDLPGWRELTGQTQAEIRGTGWADVIHADDRGAVLESWAWARAERAPADVEYRVRARDGSFRSIAARTVPVFDEGGVLREWIGTCTDVTDRRRAEAAERERNDLRNAVRALDRVLGVVGHELRTPLAATRATAELLLMEGFRETAEGEKLLRTVHDEVVRMGQMVNDLLEVARINSGTTRWNWSAVAVDEVCRGAAESMRPLVDPAVELRVEVAAPDLAMKGDTEAVHRLLVNLLSNAHKHTRSGSITVRARVVLDGGLRYVAFDVTDTGSGMSPEVAAKLGEAFVLNSGMIGGDYVKGSGLGLAICKGIVAAHGGRISVSSAKNAGTTVTALLRADLDAPARETADGVIQVEAVE